MWSVVDRNVIMRRITVSHCNHRLTEDAPHPPDGDVTKYTVYTPFYLSEIQKIQNS